MKKMFISIPEATADEIEGIKMVLQKVFDKHSKEDYLILIGKEYDSIKITTDAYDHLKSKEFNL